MLTLCIEKLNILHKTLSTSFHQNIASFTKMHNAKKIRLTFNIHKKIKVKVNIVFMAVGFSLVYKMHKS